MEERLEGRGMHAAITAAKRVGKPSSCGALLGGAGRWQGRAGRGARGAGGPVGRRQGAEQVAQASLIIGVVLGCRGPVVAAPGGRSAQPEQERSVCRLACGLGVSGGGGLVGAAGGRAVGPALDVGALPADELQAGAGQRVSATRDQGGQPSPACARSSRRRAAPDLGAGFCPMYRRRRAAMSVLSIRALQPCHPPASASMRFSVPGSTSRQSPLAAG